jgi:catechol 2,3-dioxygenase
MAIDLDSLKNTATPGGLPFKIQKLGHVVLRVTDLHRSVDFYTQVLGLKVSDVYPEEMVPGGMVFLRFNPDHHGVALVGGAPGPAAKRELDHVAFEVATLDEVFRARQHLRAHKVPILFEGRRRAGAQIAIEFHDPDGYHLEIYWGIDQIGTDGHVRPASEWRGAKTLEDAVANPVAGQHPAVLDSTLLQRKP